MMVAASLMTTAMQSTAEEKSPSTSSSHKVTVLVGLSQWFAKLTAGFVVLSMIMLERKRRVPFDVEEEAVEVRRKHPMCTRVMIKVEA
ncbi:hypothetical protein CONLIGDRAFT_308179 [Coniochaeta ligniaria NRRL 30616]|uniref:Uncharacterized protein n=1 Tax=Coniochaeta ligniaria NRRL 30616 TaxID=1408157 RepID=A0A1J7JU38_9PEZI|nr:hypothetical protein CONLIGDRAFT_308179 [Coniochaeta ligniaria NRRL 30616]